MDPSEIRALFLRRFRSEHYVAKATGTLIQYLEKAKLMNIQYGVLR